MRAWQLAQIGLARCRSSISRTDTRRRPVLSSSVVFTSGGGGGTGAARMLSSSHLPRMVGDVRVGYDVTARTLALPSRPQRFSSASAHAPEMAAVDAANPVVARQLLVQERGVGRQQIDDAAVRLDLVVEEELGFADERRPQVVVEPREPRVGVRRQQPHVAGLQPLPEEVVDQRGAGPRIGEHAPHLPIEHARLAQRALARPRRAVRRRGCCSRGRTTAATRARRPAGGRRRPAATWRGSASIRKRKSGLTSRRSSRGADAVVEAAARSRPRSKNSSSVRTSPAWPAGDTRAARASTESSSRTPCSSRGLEGRHEKMRRRLGESSGTRAVVGARRSAATR